MDEIEFKLRSGNIILITEAVDKLVKTIISKYKPSERTKFILDNSELKYLTKLCLSENYGISITACNGLIELVDIGIVDCGAMLSRVVSLLPSTHHHLAVITTITQLLIRNLRMRVIPGMPYECHFKFASPQHPFITILEKDKNVEEEIAEQINYICTHPDNVVSTYGLELVRPVFIWLTCNPERICNMKVWQVLLSLPHSEAQKKCLLTCLSSQQIRNPKQIKHAFAVYTTVTEAMINESQGEIVTALLPMLARISNELIKNDQDPRQCYKLIEKCFQMDAPVLQHAVGITLMLLAENLTVSSSSYLHELFNLCLNVVSKWEYTSISINAFVALSLQWLHLSASLTMPALVVASQILEIQREKTTDDTRVDIANLKSNKYFPVFLYTDSHLMTIYKLNHTWEQVRRDCELLKEFMKSIEMADDTFKLKTVPFLIGILMEKSKVDESFENFSRSALNILLELVNKEKSLTVQLLPILLYKVNCEDSPFFKIECLKGLTAMAKSKENSLIVLSILNKLKLSKGLPTSFLILAYLQLTMVQGRCFPELQMVLHDTSRPHPSNSVWETEIARAIAVKNICELRAATQGKELVPVISSILNRCTDKTGDVATKLALESLGLLWEARAVDPVTSWRALHRKLCSDNRPKVQIGLCELISLIPSTRLDPSLPQDDKLNNEVIRKLWSFISTSNNPEVVGAACKAMSVFKIENIRLKDVPEIYRQDVKLPPSYCKTPVDAARKPEDVLDYLPCEVWPCIFIYTNRDALQAVENWAAKWIDREVRGYRKHVFKPQGDTEPENMTHLPPSSVVRGLMTYFKKAVTQKPQMSDFSAPVVLSIFKTLCAYYPRPLPAMDLTFLQVVPSKGVDWKDCCFKLAAKQAGISDSAKNFAKTYFDTLIKQRRIEAWESKMIFQWLPTLCRNFCPDMIRDVLKKCLNDAYEGIRNIKKGHKGSYDKTFIVLLGLMKKCLQSNLIHEANRILLTQILKEYFRKIEDDNDAWLTYVDTCTELSAPDLEVLTSPSGWWEVNNEELRRAWSMRVGLVTAKVSKEPLTWLNELIETQVKSPELQEYSLTQLHHAFRAIKVDDENTVKWFLELMGTTQQHLTENSVYLCDVLMLSVVIFSGHWSLELYSDTLLPARPDALKNLLPGALDTLLRREAWATVRPQMLHWLAHTRAHSKDERTKLCCHRALVTLRHFDDYSEQKIWKLMDHHFNILGEVA